MIYLQHFSTRFVARPQPPRSTPPPPPLPPWATAVCSRRKCYISILKNMAKGLFVRCFCESFPFRKTTQSQIPLFLSGAVNGGKLIYYIIYSYTFRFIVHNKNGKTDHRRISWALNKKYNIFARGSRLSLSPSLSPSLSVSGHHYTYR